MGRKEAPFEVVAPRQLRHRFGFAHAVCAPHRHVEAHAWRARARDDIIFAAPHHCAAIHERQWPSLIGACLWEGILWGRCQYAGSSRWDSWGLLLSLPRKHSTGLYIFANSV